MAHEADGQLTSALVELDEEQVTKLVSDQLASGVPPLTIVDQMRQGMNAIGERFAKEEYFLSELIMAAEIFGTAMKTLEPHLSTESQGGYSDVVFATVKGDVHDIGKNIVVAVLRGAGFRVHDLGVDVPPEKIIATIKETDAHIVGLSALITTSYDSMKATIEAIAQAGLRDQVKIMIGGGPTDERVRTYVGADALGHDVQDAVKLARQFAGVEV